MNMGVGSAKVGGGDFIPGYHGGHLVVTWLSPAGLCTCD